MTLTPPPLFSTEAALDAYVLSREEPHPYDGMWHPSSISGCQRKAVYEMRQTEPTNPLTPKQKRVFFIGHMIHETMQSAVADFLAGLGEVYTEVKVFVPELNITGAADQVIIVVLVREDGTAELQEFKSIKEWGFKALKGPKDDHLEQVKPYMFGLREFGGIDQDGKVLKPLGDRLSRARLTYIEKATFDIKEYVVEWDPEWEPELRAKIAALDSYIEDPDSLPARLPIVKGKKSYMCDWGWGQCAFFDRCWQQDPDEVAPGDSY